MKDRKGKLSSEDQALWEAVKKTVRPLGDRPPAPALPPVRQQATARPHRALPLEWFVKESPAPDTRIDRKTRRRLAAGHMDMDVSVDLHGMTQDQAYAALRRTIENAVQRGAKAVLVVTGKGGKRFSQTAADVPVAYRTRASFEQFGGVLKRMVPLWLESAEIKPFIQSYGSAAQGHGGEGALYILLRKRIPGSKRK